MEATKKKLLEAGVKTCFATFVDIHGIPKAKATPFRRLRKCATVRNCIRWAPSRVLVWPVLMKSCNPYLCAVLHLAAGLEGIKNRADPSPLINIDVYQMNRRQLREAGISTLPPTLLHALEAFEADPFVGETFGAELKKYFLQQKMEEWNRSFFHVSTEQRDHMLTYI